MPRIALGVDLGGTKIEVAAVDDGGDVRHRRRAQTPAGDADAVCRTIVQAVGEIREDLEVDPVGVGVGVAGQVERESGVVRFAPNLDWHDVPLGASLEEALDLQVSVLNDVRAVALGEWLNGAGRNTDDMVCVFVGTGIGGGVVSAGHLLEGCSNAAGEIGHMVVDLDGPACHCGRTGCLEAFAGGWAIARDAMAAATERPDDAARLLEIAGDLKAITAETVGQAYREGDALACDIMDEVARVLTVGLVNLVNTFNPCRLILGGGVVDGVPELVARVRAGIQQDALESARARLEVTTAKLGADAGVVGAASAALRRATQH
ncbi:MAG TPA: ROK family protein [Longimicrobiales bacterium]|nr:ROK family protein [Longimicrobiales bacterium]